MKQKDFEFTEKEKEELDAFEAEHPYTEIPEEPVRIPQRPERITDTKNDVLFISLFCIGAAIFLFILVFFK